MNINNIYINLVSDILKNGLVRETRNGKVLGTFGNYIKIENIEQNFPIISLRKLYIKGVLGEFAAMINQPKTINDFEKYGCNYWKLWSKDGNLINVDYGNSWCNWNNEGINQIQQVIDTIKTNPTDRRLLITGWNPSNLNDLDLPCCHYAYQFYIRDNKYIDIYWHQRSVDVMVGLPSDIIFASIWLINLAKEVNLIPGNIYMSLGDTHIYEEHIENAKKLISNNYITQPIKYDFIFNGFWNFKPDNFKLLNYNVENKLKFILKD